MIALEPTILTFRKCRECGIDFQLPPFSLAARFVHVCPACSERHAEADQRAAAANAQQRRANAWKSICPPALLQTEAHKLPSPSKLQRVLRWNYGPRGLLLHGESGTGKSRCVWMLAKREFMAGRSIAVMNCEFGFEYASKFSLSVTEAQRWIEARMRADILLLDDSMKARLTDSAEQCLFVIANHRSEHGLPILATCNDVGETLLDRMSSDRGPALIRRLREFCEAITF